MAGKAGDGNGVSGKVGVRRWVGDGQSHVSAPGEGPALGTATVTRDDTISAVAGNGNNTVEGKNTVPRPTTVEASSDLAERRTSRYDRMYGTTVGGDRAD